MLLSGRRVVRYTIDTEGGEIMGDKRRLRSPSHSDSQEAMILPNAIQENGESKKEKAEKWVNKYALTGTGVAAAAIIPGGTAAALSSLELFMVVYIGKIYKGKEFSKEDALMVISAATFMGGVGLGLKIAMEALTFFPVWGWAIKGGIAGTIIKTLGELIIKYFESIEEGPV